MNPISNPVACLVLGFTRVDSLRALIHDLINQKTPRIYVSLDGPRNFTDLEIQNSIRLMLHEFQNENHTEIFIRSSQMNLGLRLAVIDGISWFFEHEELGVILEDDLVIHPQFQEYFSATLNNLDIRNLCMSISGNQFLDDQDCSLIHFPLIWGWATWKESWQAIHSQLTTSSELSLPWFRHPFLSGFVRAGLIRIERKQLNSWALSFLAASISNNWLHLIPPFPIVSNAGDDPSATHTTKIPGYAKPNSYNGSSQLVIPRNLLLNTKLEGFIQKKHYGVHFWHILSPVKAKLEIYRTDKK